MRAGLLLRKTVFSDKFGSVGRVVIGARAPESLAGHGHFTHAASLARVPRQRRLTIVRH